MAVSNRLARAVLELATEYDNKGVKEAVDDQKKLKAETEGLTAKFRAMGEDFGLSFNAIKVGAGIAISAVAAVATGIVALGLRGATVGDLRDSFYQLSESVGATGDEMLGALRDGSKGTISDFQLMEMANTTLGTGFIRTAADMRTLIAGARQLAEETGGSTAEAFDTLTSAMASGRTAALKQYGLFIDTKEALAAYSKQIGVAVADMNDKQRALALTTGALEALRQKLAKTGEAELDFGDRIERGKVKVQNFMDELALAIANSPAIAEAMDGIGKAIDEAFGDDQAERVQGLASNVDRLAIHAVGAASSIVTGASWIYRAWSGLKAVFVGLGTVLSGIVEMLAMANAGYAAIAASLPGASQATKDYAAAAAAGVEKQRKTTAELWEMTKAAASNAAGNGSVTQTLDAMAAALDKTKARMMAVAGATTNATGATGRNTQANRENEESTKAQERALKEQAQALKELIAEMERQDQQERSDRSAAGVITQREMNDAIDQFDRALVSSTSSGNNQAKVLALIEKKLKDLRERAVESGVAVDELDERLEYVRGTIQLLNGGPPVFQPSMFKPGIQGFADLLATAKPVTAEQMRLTTETSRMSAAYQFFGITSKAELEKAALAARKYYNDLKAGGATKAELARAAKQLADAEAAAAGKTRASWISTLDDVASGFEQLANIAGDSIASIVRSVGTGVAAVKQFDLGARQVLQGGFANIASGLTSIFSGGFTIGKILESLITPGWMVVMREVGRRWGVQISEGLAKEIDARADEIAKPILSRGRMGEMAIRAKEAARDLAEILSLDKILAESGDLSSGTIDAWIGRARPLFDLIRKGGKDGADATKTMTDLLRQFGEQAEKTGGRWSLAFKQMLAEARELGVGLETITELVEGQLAIVANSTEQVVGDLSSRLEAEFKRLSAMTDEQAADEEQRKAITKAANAEIVANYQEEFDRISRITFASFNAYIAQGHSAVEASRVFGSAIDQLKAKAEQFGFANSHAFHSLASWRELVSQNEPLLNQIDGLTQLTQALDNINGMTAESFADIQAQGMEAYDRLIAAGFSEQAALQQMAPLLTMLRDMQRERGYAVDETTQKLIDQAEQQDLLAEKEQSVQSVLMDAFSTLFRAMGIEGPEAWKKFAKAGKDAAKDVQSALDGIEAPEVTFLYRQPDFDGGFGTPGVDPSQGDGSDSPNGFKWGTPDLDFANFRRSGQAIVAHGSEAIIPQGRGHELAGEIATALAGVMPTSGERGDVVLVMDSEVVGRIVAKKRATQEELIRQISYNTHGLGTAVRQAAGA